MIILLNEGQVQTCPAYIQQGTGGEDVTIITPPLTEQLVLKVTPPSRMQISDIYCTKQFGKTTEEGNEIYTCKLPAEVTQYNGKALYQLCHIAPDGKTTRAEVGSFTIQKGIISEMPTSVEDLAQKSIDELYAILATYQAKAQQVQNIEEKIGLTEEYSEDAQPQWKPISEEIDGTDIVTTINNLNDKVNNAVSALEEQDGVLDGKITAEKNRAQGVESTLQSAINTENQRARQAEQTLQNNINAEEQRATGAENALGGRIDTANTNIGLNAISIAKVMAEVNGRGRLFQMTLQDFITLLDNGSVQTDVTGEELSLDKLVKSDTIHIIQNYTPDVWFVKGYNDGFVGNHTISWYYLEVDGIYNPVPADIDHALLYTLNVDVTIGDSFGYFLKEDSDYEYINGQAHSASVSATQASASAERAEYAEGSASAYATDANQYAFSAEQARDDVETMLGNRQWQVLTRSDYDALPAKDANTFYLVTEG